MFFPLYPLLMRWGGALLGGHPLIAGLLVSLISFAGAIALLYRLAVLEMREAHALASIRPWHHDEIATRFLPSRPRRSHHVSVQTCHVAITVSLGGCPQGSDREAGIAEYA